MAVQVTRKPLGIGALAVIAAGCTDARDVPFDRPNAAEPVSGEVAEAPEPIAWSDEQRLEAGDAAERDQLGYAASLGADRAVLGAYGDNSYRGAAYVFVRDGTSFSEEQKLVAADGASDDQLGFAVALAGDRTLIGAPGDDTARGSALVFVRRGASWSEEQKLVATDRAESARFGWSVSLGDGRALVGASGSDGARGAAYVFVRSESSWSGEQKLVASDGAIGDQLGYSVSFGDDRVLVGAPANDGARGAAYVFVRHGSSWSEEQKLVASDAEENDLFGVAVSLAGDRALVGAYFDDERRGAVYVFERSSGAWTEAQKLVASDAAAGYRFGNAVSLVTDFALIGAYGHSAGRGAAYVFARNDGPFVEEAKLVASDGIDNDLFGWSVSLAGDRALVGAYYDDNLRGAAYVFSRACDVCTAELEGDDSGCTCRAGYPRRRAPSSLIGVILASMLVESRRIRRQLTASSRSCSHR